MIKPITLGLMLAILIAVAAGCARNAVPSSPPAAQPAATAPATTPAVPVPAPPVPATPAPASEKSTGPATAAAPAATPAPAPKSTAPIAPKKQKIQNWRVMFKGISRLELSMVRQTLIGGDGIVSIGDARAEAGLFILNIKTTLSAGDLMGRLESIRNPRLEVVATDPAERIIQMKSAASVY